MKLLFFTFGYIFIIITIMLYSIVLHRVLKKPVPTAQNKCNHNDYLLYNVKISRVIYRIIVETAAIKMK